MAETESRLRRVSDKIPAAQKPSTEECNTAAGGVAKQPSDSAKASIGQVISSVIAGAVGVQSRTGRERDFAQSSVLPFIIGGLLFTALFVGGLALLVKLLLA